jgi:hypothetical protein
LSFSWVVSIVNAVLEQHDGGQGEDERHRDALEGQRDERRYADVLVGDVPARQCADREEDVGRHGDGGTEGVEELLEEDGEPGQPGGADEQVAPQQRPAGDHAGGRAEAARGVGVHRAGRGRPLGELVEAQDHEQQHHRAEQVRQPGALAGVGKRQRNDEHGGHRGRDKRDRLGEQRRKSECAGPET